MHVSVYLKFNKNQSDSFTLLVEGEYYEGTKDTYLEKGDDPEFEMESIKLIHGDLQDLLLMNLTIEAIEEKVFEEL
jgi:hypothetical protein